MGGARREEAAVDGADVGLGDYKSLSHGFILITFIGPHLGLDHINRNRPF